MLLKSVTIELAVVWFVGYLSHVEVRDFDKKCRKAPTANVIDGAGIGMASSAQARLATIPQSS